MYLETASWIAKKTAESKDRKIPFHWKYYVKLKIQQTVRREKAHEDKAIQCLTVVKTILIGQDEHHILQRTQNYPTRNLKEVTTNNKAV